MHKKRVVTVPNYRKGKGKAFAWMQAHVAYEGDECLTWPFSRDGRVGRGRIQHNGKQAWAHRFMCELAHGPAPTPKHQAGHNCGKGHEGCVNPRHLEWKTNAQNQLDRAAHGTVMRKWTKKLTAAQGEQMRALRPTKTIVELAKMFGCSFGTVCYYLKYREQRGHAAGVQPHWTPEEDAALRSALPNRSFRQAAEIVGRSAEACQGRAYKLGLRSGWNGPGGISLEQRRLRDGAPLVNRFQ